MEIYCVGGAVRDELLGLPVQDRDYVVVGASPEEMIRLGFTPVGKDFPVFLHPITHEQYALARTERKVARGYKGFTIYAAPEVTLEQDLERRDLTINAIARDAAGKLVDPFGGERDLRAGLLRHIGPAFAEDPVRLLRVARFAARFGFQVAGETMALMQRMVAQGEADALVPERVWQEFSRGLMEPLPATMLSILARSGFLDRLLPELGLAILGGAPANDAARIAFGALGHAAFERHALSVRFAALLSSFLAAGPGESALHGLCDRLRVPNDCRELALLMLRHGGMIRRATTLGPREMLSLLEACDAFRRPTRLEDLLRVCEGWTRAARGWPDIPYAPGTVMRRALAAAAAIDAGAIAAHSDKSSIATSIRAARTAAIRVAIGARRKRVPEK